MEHGDGLPLERDTLEPIGIFPGATRGELVVVFRLRIDRESRLYRYSTLDRKLLVVASSRRLVNFSGFIPPLPCRY